MARIRSHYAKDEIITNLYTYGLEFMYDDNIEYIGPYHRYITGEIYTEATWNESTSKKLILYVNINTVKYRYKQLNTIKTSYKSFNEHILELTPADYDAGYVTRYFISKLNDRSIVEISKQTYDDYNGNLIDPSLYSAISIKWTIEGYQTTQYQNGITIIGVAEKNRSELIKAEQKLSGISIKLNNLLEFYTDTEYSIPRDIN